MTEVKVVEEKFTGSAFHERFKWLLPPGLFMDPAKSGTLQTKRHYAFVGTTGIFITAIAVFIALLATELTSFTEVETVNFSATPIEGQDCSGLSYDAYRFVFDAQGDGIFYAVLNYAAKYSTTEANCRSLVSGACQGYYDYLNKELYTMPELCRSDWYAGDSVNATKLIDGQSCPAANIDFEAMKVQYDYFPMTWIAPDDNMYAFIYPEVAQGNAITVSIVGIEGWTEGKYPLSKYMYDNPSTTYTELINQCSDGLDDICEEANVYCGPFSCVTKNKLYPTFFEGFSVAFANTRALVTISLVILCYALPKFYPSEKK